LINFEEGIDRGTIGTGLEAGDREVERVGVEGGENRREFDLVDGGAGEVAEVIARDSFGSGGAFAEEDFVEARDVDEDAAGPMEVCDFYADGRIAVLLEVLEEEVGGRVGIGGILEEAEESGAIRDG